MNYDGRETLRKGSRRIALAKVYMNALAMLQVGTLCKYDIVLTMTRKYVR
jgi:hypothetical protein